MTRRKFITLLGGAAVVSWPARPRAEQRSKRLIGLLGGASPASSTPQIQAWVGGLRELGYVEDVYSEPPRFVQIPPAITNDTASLTNRSRRRINEAELVRMLRDGQNLETDMDQPRRPSATPPAVQDPALARALDLLKGLAVVQQTRTVGAELKN